MAITPMNLVLFTLAEAATVFYIFPNVFLGHTLSYTVVAFTLLNTFVASVYKLIIYPFFLSPLRHLPQGKGFVPLVGHAIKLFGRPPGDPHLQMMMEVPNDGLILTKWFLHADRLIATNPTAIADVLVNKNYDFEKPSWSRAFLRKFLGDGLLITEGEEHKHHRKQIMPAFHFRNIKELYPIFWSKSIEFCNTIKASLNEDPAKTLEIGHYCTQVTLDIIGLAGLGRDIASLRNGEDELIAIYEEILEPTTEKGVYFLLHLAFPPWFVGLLPWKLNERVKVNTRNLRRICREFVRDKKLKMKSEDLESESGRDILSIMIRSNNFSDENLADQLLTFLAAGHETTSSALTWSSYLLSKHPDVQKRLRSEVHQKVPDPTVLSNPSFDISSLLENMPYLNSVCNEVLRLFPTIPISARHSICDTTVAGHFIPKNTVIYVVPWAINRNPVLWGPDAGEFIPERWLDKGTGRATMNGGADSNYSFLTFLHGPRGCIGERFARAELRALIATFVGSFEMQMADPSEKVVIGGTITSKPMNGMKLKLQPVDWGH